MDKNKELAKNTVIIAIGRICTQFISFLLLPLYTSLLSTDEYGIVDLVNTYAQLILPIIILQMDQALFRFMIQARRGEENMRSCISTSSFAMTVQFVLLSCIFLVVNALYTNQYSIYVYLNVAAMLLSGYMLQTARGLGDNVSYSIASFLAGAITIVCNVIFIVGLHMKVEGMLLSSVIGNLSAFAFVFLKDKVYKQINIKTIDIGLLRKMLKYAWPLVPNALIWWVVNASDRSIVLAFLGTSASGILAVAHKFPSLIMVLYNIFHLSWTESAALHLREKDKETFFSGVFDTALRVFGTLCILTIAGMPFVFNIFINYRFNAAYYQIPIYVIASLFNVVTSLFSVIYISEMKTAEIAKTSLWAGIINVIVDFALIRYVGLFAASISSAVAFGTMAVYRAIDSRKYIKYKHNIHLTISLLTLIVVGIIIYNSPSITVKVLYVITSIVYAIMINRKNIKSGWDIVKSKTQKG